MLITCAREGNGRQKTMISFLLARFWWSSSDFAELYSALGSLFMRVSRGTIRLSFVHLAERAELQNARWRTRKRHNSVAVVSEATNKFIERVLAWRLPDRARLDGPEGDERALENPPWDRHGEIGGSHGTHGTRSPWGKSGGEKRCSKVNCT